MNYNELILTVTQLVMENQDLHNRLKNVAHLEEVSEIRDEDYSTYAKAKIFDACFDTIFREIFLTWNIDKYPFENCIDSSSMKKFLQVGVTMDELKLVFMNKFLSVKAEKQKENAEENDQDSNNE